LISDSLKKLVSHGRKPILEEGPFQFVEEGETT
jgi:hypothetical protein